MEIFTRLAVALKEMEATIVQLTVFGCVEASEAGAEAMRRVFGRVDWPVTWIEGAACDGGPIAGLQVVALSGGEVGRVEWSGRVAGSVFEAEGARHCVVGGLGPRQIYAPCADQTKQALENLQRALAQAGFSLSDTARTWFFLDEILSWYDQFNRSRSEIYSGVKFRSGSLPASTGVGARNPGAAALAVGAWAIQPLDASTCIQEVASPLQCPAPAYGSSFSRAMEIRSAGGRRLFISGTASIAPGGETMWRGDVRRQVTLAMEVVEAILRSRGFEFSQLTRATAYFRDNRDAGLFSALWAEHRQGSLPVVTVQCDICRDDLLFELEADAWRPA